MIDPNETRLRVYTRFADQLQLIAETSLEGLGLCLVTLREENQVPDWYRLGIYDTAATDPSRRWLLSPFVKGTP